MKLIPYRTIANVPITISSISTAFLNIAGDARLKLYAPNHVPMEKGINKIAD